MESRLIHIEYEKVDDEDNRAVITLSLREENLKTISFSTSFGGRVVFTREDFVAAFVQFQKSQPPKTPEEKLHKDMCALFAEMDKEIRSSKDPWKHRSEGMRCRTCMWYAGKAVMTRPAIGGPAITNMTITADEDGNILPKNKKGIGRCRRHAPTMNGYPVCFEDDWCGDHKLDENKV